MLSSKTLCFSSTLRIVSVLFQPLSRTLNELTRSTVADIRLGSRCYSCSVIHRDAFRRRNTFEEAVFKNAQSRAFSRKQGKNAFYSDPESSFGDIDAEEMEDDSHDPVNNALPNKERVRVKFNWKNSLVSTNAVTLLENLYRTYPQLIEFNESDLVYFLQKMSTFSIDVDKASKMVIQNPRLLEMSESKIGTYVAALRAIGLGETQRSHVLRSVPQLFNLPPKRIVDQFTFLKTYFSTQESADIVCKAVEVFLESETTLKTKLDYLIKDMSHETKNLINCKALTYSFRHIRARHEILIRCGVFKPIPYRKLIKVLEKDYKDRNKPRNKYFKPMEIVCYNDEDFLKTCTKSRITLNELAAFEELYAAELDMIEDGDEQVGNAAVDDEDFDEEDDFQGGTVSLVRSPNSTGFFNNVEARSCYF